MSSVREGAFDPGPAPPEPVREVSASEADTKQTEDFRAKVLRRAKEQEDQAAKALDWYGQFAVDADPGDAASALPMANVPLPDQVWVLGSDGRPSWVTLQPTNIGVDMASEPDQQFDGTSLAYYLRCAQQVRDAGMTPSKELLEHIAKLEAPGPLLGAPHFERELQEQQNRYASEVLHYIDKIKKLQPGDKIDLTPSSETPDPSRFRGLTVKQNDYGFVEYLTMKLGARFYMARFTHRDDTAAVVKELRKLANDIEHVEGLVPAHGAAAVKPGEPFNVTSCDFEHRWGAHFLIRSKCGVEYLATHSVLSGSGLLPMTREGAETWLRLWGRDRAEQCALLSAEAVATKWPHWKRLTP